MARGWSVSGTTRSAEKAARLNAIFKSPNFCAFDLSQSLDIQKALSTAHAVLSTVPPSRTCDTSQIDPVLASYDLSLAQQATWVGYLSTTGVYGNLDGGWADEHTPLAPSGSRGQRRVDAERSWRETGLPLHIFRLPGIYGPKYHGQARGPLEQIRSGTARRIDRPGHVFCRIHVDDIAAALSASVTHPMAGGVWNLVDDCPAAPAEVIAYACTLLKVEPPPLVSFEVAKETMSAMALSFWQDSRRIRNTYMKSTLLPKLKWPDYRCGLSGLVSGAV